MNAADDVVDAATRLAVPIRENDVYALIDHAEDNPQWTWGLHADDLGWDLFRLNETSDCGQDQFHNLLVLLDDAGYRQSTRIGVQQDDSIFASPDVILADVERHEYVAARFAKFDRERQPSDRLVIDLIDEARHEGLTPSQEIAQALERLEKIASARRDEIETEIEAAWSARIDSIVAEATAERFREMGAPMPAGYVGAPAAMPMLNTQAVVADLGRPAVEAFLAAQSGQAEPDAPTLPDVISAHPLFESLNSAIGHVVASAERAPKTFRASSAVDMLAVLSAAHMQVFETVCARIRASGAPLPDGRLSAAVRRFEAQVAREVRTGAGWATDSKGMPDGSNTDNVAIFVRTMGADLRFNAWSQRSEIRWSSDAEWAPLQEKDFNHLLTTAANGQYNFRPRESMFKRALSALAHEDTFDPVLIRIAAAQAAWDGTPRLDSWLAKATGLPDDAYHRAVGRNLAGGIVKRARRPGVKHDEVVILIGPEDTLKSTFCRLLALDDQWFSDSVAFEGSPQNIVPQLFGKLVIELAELDGMARREVQYIKRFLSAQSDNVTLKYEAFASDHARRCVFIGTSNESNPLRGDAGNRRFLPVRIEKRIDIDFVRANIEQIVGEAAMLEAAGELFLIPHDVLPEARARQEDARAESDFEIHLNAWFAGKVGATYILPADLAAVLKDATGRSVPSNQYGMTMRRLGFVQMTARLGGEPTRVWCRGGMDGAHRYAVHRGVDGRSCPKLPMLAPPPPTPSGSAVVLPIRPQ